jgi:hypothetical protein
MCNTRLLVTMGAIATLCSTGWGSIIFEEKFEGAPFKVMVDGSNVSDWGVVEDSTSPEGPHVAKFGINGGYPNNANTFLVMDKVDLSAGAGWLLAFRHHYNIEKDPEGNFGYDGLRVVGSPDDGANWHLLTPVGGYPFSYVNVFDTGGYSGESNTWALGLFDLSALQESNQVLVAFQFASDSDNSTAPPGFEGFWSVDGIRIGDRISLLPYIPEPATLSLLALGGLMALRRRR